MPPFSVSLLGADSLKTSPQKNMIIVSDYKLNEKTPGVFVRCAEVVPSPCCMTSLSVIGSRKRKLVHASGEKSVLVIRRLRCTSCRKIHHELPDCIVPYKRYESECLESVITSEELSDVNVASDNSTLHRWRSWFCSIAAYLQGCLESIAIRFHLDVVKERSAPSQSAHHRFGRYVGDAGGWLARIVRPIANSNLWIHTRSACLSEVL